MKKETIQELHRTISKEHAQMVSTTDGSEEAHDHTQITLQACIDELKVMAEYIEGMSANSYLSLMDRARELQKQMT